LNIVFHQHRLAAVLPEPLDAMSAATAQTPLGDLELIVLEDGWAYAPTDAKGAHRRIGANRPITVNTVQSTLERLYRKGLLARDKVSHAYAYRPAVSRQELVGRLVESAVRRFMGDSPGAMLAALVDLALRTGDDQLAQFEALVAERRAPPSQTSQ
jgi:predicted transcriptional regulator